MFEIQHQFCRTKWICEFYQHMCAKQSISEVSAIGTGQMSRSTEYPVIRLLNNQSSQYCSVESWIYKTYAYQIWGVLGRYLHEVCVCVCENSMPKKTLRKKWNKSVGSLDSAHLLSKFREIPEQHIRKLPSTMPNMQVQALSLGPKFHSVKT